MVLALAGDSTMTSFLAIRCLGTRSRGRLETWSGDDTDGPSCHLSRPEAALHVDDHPIPHVFLDDSAPAFSAHFVGPLGVGKDDLESFDNVSNRIDNKSCLTWNDGLGSATGRSCKDGKTRRGSLEEYQPEALDLEPAPPAAAGHTEDIHAPVEVGKRFPRYIDLESDIDSGFGGELAQSGFGPATADNQDGNIRAPLLEFHGGSDNPILALAGDEPADTPNQRRVVLRRCLGWREQVHLNAGTNGDDVTAGEPGDLALGEPADRKQNVGLAESLGVAMSADPAPQQEWLPRLHGKECPPESRVPLSAFRPHE